MPHTNDYQHAKAVCLNHAKSTRNAHLNDPEWAKKWLKTMVADGWVTEAQANEIRVLCDWVHQPRLLP